MLESKTLGEIGLTYKNSKTKSLYYYFFKGILVKSIHLFFKILFLLFVIANITCSSADGKRQSTQTQSNYLFDLKMAGFQINSGKLVYFFGGNFKYPASRFKVIDVTNKENLIVVMDIQQPISEGMQFFTAPVSEENSQWLRTKGETRMDFDVVVFDFTGSLVVIQQGTSFSEASKKTLSIVLDSNKK